ncbi:MAG: hypothetical protein ABMA01_20530 [Chthoniobacteraceae bacterium]
MTRTSLILLLSGIFAFASDAPKQAIPTAEAAILRFRDARENELKVSLTEKQREIVTRLTSVGYLTVSSMRPGNYQPPYRDVRFLDDPKYLIFGTFAAAADSKTNTWHLFYDTGSRGALVIFLDSITGKVLYIQIVPEG